jgi:hemerythrin-like domain-containing protein
MTDPFDYLDREHQQIHDVLDVLERLALEAKEGAVVNISDVADLIEYLMDYGGLSHHEKEESILTPVLVRFGLDWSAEPLVSVRREHRQVRSLVRSVYHLAKQSEPWSREDARTFASLSLEYVSYSRRHMRRESGMFDLVRDRIDAGTKQELSHRFAALDAEVQRGVEYRKSAGRTERLVTQYRRCGDGPGKVGVAGT